MMEFVSADPQTLLSDAVSRYEAASGETLYPGDEHYMFLSQMIELVVACREEINSAANQNLLKYCSGDVLDEYGSQYDVTRIAAHTSSAAVEFSLSASLGFDVTVPAGTRVTPDGRLIFGLSADTVIRAGENSARGTVIAEVAGAEYNGFLPGQINNMVDLVESVNSVRNVTASAGGSNEEDDDGFRGRIRQRWEAISTAGSKESYEYWAKTASADIADARAVKTAAGEVTVYILMSDAATPSQAILDAVAAVCGAEKHRPLTDKVTIAAAEVLPYDITLTYYISSSRSTEESVIKAAVEQAITNFAEAQKRELGGNLNSDGLRSAILTAGAYRVDLTSPSFTVLEPRQVAVAETVTPTYGGLL